MTEGCFQVESHQLTGVGYGLDIGGSLAKLAYVSKDRERDTDKVCVYTKSFPKDNIDELIKFICHHCDLGMPGSTLNVTGFGCHTNKGKLQKALNVKLNVMLEFDCFAKALVWCVSNLPMTIMVHPPNEEAQRKATDTIKAWGRVAINVNGENEEEPQTSDLPGSDNSDTDQNQDNELAMEVDRWYISKQDDKSHDHLPCLVAMLGSGVGYYVVNGSKGHYIVGGSSYGGQSLTGLSKLLTGTKDFTELMELAVRGRNTGVDTCGCHMRSRGHGSDTTNLYSAYPVDETVYYYGQLNHSDGTVKKEDLAASLVTSFCTDLVPIVHTLAKVHKVKTIFFAGSMPQHPHVRYLLEKNVIQWRYMFDPESDVTFGFLRNGGQLGALGTLLN